MAMLAMSTNNPHATTTQPSWLEDVMAHVQPHHMPEFSEFASGKDASVFWESGSIVTDSFAPPTDHPIQVLPAPSPLGEFQTHPSSKSPTGRSPDAQPESVLGAVDDSLPPSRTRYGGPVLTGEYLAGVTVMNEYKSPGGEVVVRGQTSCTATRQSRKRKPDQVVSDDNSNKENMSSTRPAPAAKRIRREKTGTEWQTVFDGVKFGEEQQRKENEAVIRKMTTCGRSLEVLSLTVEGLGFTQ